MVIRRQVNYSSSWSGVAQRTAPLLTEVGQGEGVVAVHIEPAVSEYAFAPDPEMCFNTARASLEEMIAAARGHGAAGDWTADATESAVIDDSRAVALAVLQGFFDTRAVTEAKAKARAEADLDAPVDAAGVRHTRCEPRATDELAALRDLLAADVEHELLVRGGSRLPAIRTWRRTSQVAPNGQQK